jgi:rare lipoprotein A
MVFKRDGQIVESAREARQAERGPTVRNLLIASTALAIIALGIVWLVFFKTWAGRLSAAGVRSNGGTFVAASACLAARQQREGFNVRHPHLFLTILLFFLTVLLFISVDPDPALAESGLASYYGGTGRRDEMTCAHRTRQFGTFVTVSHGGYSVRCRINDRGPFVRGRIIDVSLGAARALHMLRSGVIRVSVE